LMMTMMMMMERGSIPELLDRLPLLWSEWHDRHGMIDIKQKYSNIR
jgi:hypothetical protein